MAAMLLYRQNGYVLLIHGQKELTQLSASTEC